VTVIVGAAATDRTFHTSIAAVLRRLSSAAGALVHGEADSLLIWLLAGASTGGSGSGSGSGSTGCGVSAALGCNLKFTGLNPNLGPL
jgi:hypothetical protein